MSKSLKVALCLPWYAGADRDCVSQFLVFSNYLGKLQERLYWFDHGARQLITGGDAKMAPLDPVEKDAEIPLTLIGSELEFAICDETGCSLPGLARERCVDAALRWGATHLLFWDADMLFCNSAFLKLLADDKPVVAALAFTGRKPLTPVIYSFKWGFNEERGVPAVDIQPVWDYERDALQQVDAVGFGMVMIQADVFQKLKKPWFHSPGVGEDIWFAVICAQAGIPVYVDTRVKAIHKPTFHEHWHDELLYLKTRGHELECAPA